MGKIDRIKYRSDYTSMKIRTLEEGEWTGIPEVISGSIYLTDALVYKDSRLLSINCNYFLKLLEIKKFEDYILKYITKDYFLLHSQLENYTPMQKIVQFFKIKMDSLVENKRDQRDFVIDITQESLADFLGFARETINRNLKILEKKGIISISRGRIKIKNMEELNKLCEIDNT